mgnify:CR=1 FL=1
MSLIDTLKNESNFKLGVAAVVLITILFLTFYTPHDEEYMEEVEKELILAKKICENSRNVVLSQPKRLKLSHNKLDDIKVNGKRVELKHVEYPRVLFFHTGFKHTNAGNELFCQISDPRGTSKDYFYDYEYRVWKNNTRTRR